MNSPADEPEQKEPNAPAALEKSPSERVPTQAATRRHRPGFRSLLHLSALLLAFPLVYLASPDLPVHGKFWAAAICLAGVPFNLFVLPRLPGMDTIRRAGEPLFSGIALYPLGLAIAFLIFPPFAVAAGWAALAIGDAAAVTIGRRIPKPPLAWNHDKSWAGTLAFGICAIPACVLLIWFAGDPLLLTEQGHFRWPLVWTLGVVAALSGALLESMKGPFDDNPRVAIGVSTIVWGLALFLNFSMAGMPAERVIQPEWFLHALIVNALLAIGVFAFRLADLPGALAGGVAGALIYYFVRPQGYGLLIVFVLGGSLLSRVGLVLKESRGAAEPRGGRRGIGNVVANLLIPVACTFLYILSRGHPAALLAFAGALSAAFADTASSELGSLAMGKPRLITTGEVVNHGTNGGITFSGYAAATAASFLIALTAWFAGFWGLVEHGHATWRLDVDPARGILFVLLTVLGGLLGTTIDSILGARFENKIPGFGKGTVNVLCTLSGAAFPGAIGMYLW